MKVDAPRRTRVTALAAIFVGVVAPALTFADEAADRKAEAQRLFTEGQTALDKGDNASGCVLMRTSLELFAVANSLFNVAQCDEREGKLASALAHWKRGFLLIDATDKRAPVVTKAIEELEIRVPRVRIAVSPKHEPLDVSLDDEVIQKDKLDAVMLIDPGKHIVLVRKAGHSDHRVEILLNERERTEVVAEPGEALPAPLPSASVVPRASASVVPPLPPPLPPPRTAPLKVGGFVALGVGGAAILGAIITGGVIEANHDKIDGLCEGIICKDGRPIDLIQSQERLLPLNATLWGIGIAGAAAGAVMLVISSQKPKNGKTAIVIPLASRDGVGIGLSGRF